MNLVKHLPYPVKCVIRTLLHLIGRYGRKAFSQEGEDILLSRFIEKPGKGFYVDVGAHHPSRCSNTYMFYKRGWRGINIDAMPGSMGPFNIARPRDINLEIAISEKKGTITFHSFKEPLFNSADTEVAQSRRELFGEAETPENTHTVPCDTLGSILDQYLPEDTEIDFLSIDIEGLDLIALKSNNWDKYRPQYILVEILGAKIMDLPKTEVFSYLDKIGYEPVAKLVHTVVFREKTIGKIQHY